MTQTTEVQAPPIKPRNDYDPQSCPEWCTAGSKEHPCHGEHSTLSTGSFIPVSGGYFGRVEESDGGRLPTVGVGLYWSEHWGGGQELTVQLTDPDVTINLKPNEGLALATEIVIMLHAMVHASNISIEDGERVLELVSVSKSLESMLTRKVTT